MLIPSLEQHPLWFDCPPRRATAEAGFFSAANEARAEQMGVQQGAVPSQCTQSATRKQRQKKRWFRKAQRGRTGSEGRISVLKRRPGLNRSRYKGSAGNQRWVGLGVLADHVINIGRAMVAAAVQR